MTREEAHAEAIRAMRADFDRHVVSMKTAHDAEVERLRKALAPLAALADQDADGEFWIGHTAAVQARAALEDTR